MSVSAAALLGAEMLLAFAILYREGLVKKSTTAAVTAVFLLGAFALRLASFDFESGDWLDWVSRWIGYFREGGAWQTLGTELWACNYNMPYLYALALISLLPLRDLYLVKALSVLCDIMMAWAGLKLVGLVTESDRKKRICFLGILLLPTVLLNGAYWGQCDSVYTVFVLWSLYFVLSNRPVPGMIFLAVALSVKLQAIFIFPLYLILLFAKKIRIRHLFIFPAAYVATLLPAVLAGRNFWDLLLFYFNNTDTVGAGLNYNSPSLFSVTEFSAFSEAGATALGILMAFTLCAFMFIFAYLHKEQLTDRVLILAALVFCIGVPYLLPHMHDRYFFMADVLSFIAAVIWPSGSGRAAAVSFGSLIGYHAYLKSMYIFAYSYRHPLLLGGLAMGLAFALALVSLMKEFRRSKKTIGKPCQTP